MPTTLTLIRHGVTDWNLTHRAQGHAPVPLAEQGRIQARLLADAYRGQNGIAALYSSDLRRCRETIAPLAEVLGLPVSYDTRLQEIDLGNWQGMTRAEWEAFDGEYYARFMADPVNVPFPGGENRPMLTERVMASLQNIVATHAGEHVIVVTHGGPIRSVLRYFQHWPYRPWLDPSPSVGNTSRTTLHVTDDGSAAEMVSLLDTSHLPEDLLT